MKSKCSLLTQGLFQQGVLEYLSAFDEETAEVCSLDSPRPLALPLVEEEEAVSEPEPEGLPEACEDSEVADDGLGEGIVGTELSQEDPTTKAKAGFTPLSSSPCYYFYQGEAWREEGWAAPGVFEGHAWPTL